MKSRKNNQTAVRWRVARATVRGCLLRVLSVGGLSVGLAGCGDHDATERAQAVSAERDQLHAQREELAKQRERVRDDLALFAVAIRDRRAELEPLADAIEPMRGRQARHDAAAHQLAQSRETMAALDDQRRELNQQYDGKVLPRTARRSLLDIQTRRKNTQATIATLKAQVQRLVPGLAELAEAQQSYASAKQSLAKAESAHRKLENAAAQLAREIQRLDQRLKGLQE